MTDILKKLPYKKIALVTVAILFMGLVAVAFWKDSQTYTDCTGENGNRPGTRHCLLDTRLKIIDIRME